MHTQNKMMNKVLMFLLLSAVLRVYSRNGYCCQLDANVDLLVGSPAGITLVDLCDRFYHSLDWTVHWPYGGRKAAIIFKRFAIPANWPSMVAFVYLSALEY